MTLRAPETTSGANDTDVTRPPENAAQGNLMAPSTVLAKVCTCQIDGNRIDSASCPRHGDLVRDAEWDAISGNHTTTKDKR